MRHAEIKQSKLTKARILFKNDKTGGRVLVARHPGVSRGLITILRIYGRPGMLFAIIRNLFSINQNYSRTTLELIACLRARMPDVVRSKLQRGTRAVLIKSDSFIYKKLQ